MAHKRIQMDDGLNLVPIMNLVTILIPFLLMSAQFVSLAVIDSTLPAITDGPTDPNTDPDDVPLNLSIIVSPNGFTITGHEIEQILDPASDATGPKVPCLDAACRAPEAYDYHGLTERLAKVKNQHEDEVNVILVPDSSIPYEVLVLTMDAARDDQNDKDSENKARELFPFVVLAGGVN